MFIYFVFFCPLLFYITEFDPLNGYTCSKTFERKMKEEDTKEEETKVDMYMDNRV